MEKKNGFNIMLFVIIIIFIPLLSCSKTGKNDNEGQLMQDDRDFTLTCFWPVKRKSLTQIILRI